MEVVLENGSDDRAHSSERSQLDLESILANDECSEVGLEEIPDDADVNKFYEVEEIIDVHLNRQYHSEEYKMRFGVMVLNMTCRFLVLLSENLFNFKLSQREEEYVNTKPKMNVKSRFSRGNGRSNQM